MITGLYHWALWQPPFLNSLKHTLITTVLKWYKGTLSCHRSAAHLGCPLRYVRQLCSSSLCAHHQVRAFSSQTLAEHRWELTVAEPAARAKEIQCPSNNPNDSWIKEMLTEFFRTLLDTVLAIYLSNGSEWGNVTALWWPRELCDWVCLSSGTPVHAGEKHHCCACTGDALGCRRCCVEMELTQAWGRSTIRFGFYPLISHIPDRDINYI